MEVSDDIGERIYLTELNISMLEIRIREGTCKFVLIEIGSLNLCTSLRTYVRDFYTFFDVSARINVSSHIYDISLITHSCSLTL